MMRTPLLCLLHVALAFTSTWHPQLRPIPRRHNISYAEFRDEFGEPGVPVVISSAVSHWPAAQWTTSTIRQRCGSEPVTRECDEWDNQIKFYNGSLIGDEWGSLQEANLTKESISILLSYFTYTALSLSLSLSRRASRLSRICLISKRPEVSSIFTISRSISSALRYSTMSERRDTFHSTT
jgi:hypothetical protein